MSRKYNPRSIKYSKIKEIFNECKLENEINIKKEEIDYIDVAKRRLFLAWEGLEKKTRKYIKEENLIAEFKER